MGAPQSSRSTQARRHLAIHEDHLGGVTDRDRRAVIEAAGIKDVLAKSLGSSNHANVVKATIAALKTLRLREEIYKIRGISKKEAAVTEA